MFKIVISLAVLGKSQEVLSPCCDRMVVDGKLLKGRGAGIYRLQSGDVNGRAFYQQEGGNSYIYHTGTYYAIGEQSETEGIIYEATDGRRLFLRSFIDEISISTTLVTRCPSDIGGWAIRIPFSTIWTYGHQAAIGCMPGEYTGTFDAASNNIQYGPGGTSTG